MLDPKHCFTDNLRLKFHHSSCKRFTPFHDSTALGSPKNPFEDPGLYLIGIHCVIRLSVTNKVPDRNVHHPRQITSIPTDLPLIAMVDQVDALAVTQHQVELIAPKHLLTYGSNFFVQQLNAVDLRKRHRTAEQFLQPRKLVEPLQPWQT